MSDQDTGAAPGAQANAEGAGAPTLNIHGQYIKDLSFEAPNAPAIFQAMQSNQPDITINVDVAAAPLQEPEEGKTGVYEVILNLQATCKSGEQTAFIAELTYGGIFEVGVPKDHVQPLLLIECPRLLFPFARNILADMTRDGGFPPLMLSPIDFTQLYQQRLAQGANPAVDQPEG